MSISGNYYNREQRCHLCYQTGPCYCRYWTNAMFYGFVALMIAGTLQLTWAYYLGPMFEPPKSTLRLKSDVQTLNTKHSGVKK